MKIVPTHLPTKTHQQFSFSVCVPEGVDIVQEVFYLHSCYSPLDQHQENDLPTISKNNLFGLLK